MPKNGVTDLVAVLGQQRILDPGLLNEVRTLQTRLGDPRALFRELIQRGWLTTFQVNEIMQGRSAGLVLGSYLIMDRLGEGAAGQVYKARHLMMNRVAALKVLRKELLADPEVVARFFREIEVASHISHPNIVHAYDAGPAGTSLVMAMEFVDGVNLETFVKQSGKLAVAQACDYIRQAALGLQHAHEKGLIHRDIKPSNLLVTHKTAAPGASAFGVLKILDLGLARLSQPAHNSATKNLTVMAGSSVMQGTPDYMAPEQALDFHSADTRSDIYSLGCTFFFLLAGQPPFASSTLAEKLMKHQSAAPPPLDEFRKDVQPVVLDILRKMMAKRPLDRFQTPGAVAQALTPLVPARRKSGMQAADVVPPSSADRSVSTHRSSALKMPPRRSKVDVVPRRPGSSGNMAVSSLARRRKLLIVGGVASVLLVGLVAVLLLSGGSDEKELAHVDTTAPRSRPDPAPRTARTVSTGTSRPDTPRPREARADKLQPPTFKGKDFDGTKDRVEVAHDPALEPKELTVEAWINPASLPNKDDVRRWIVNKNVHEHNEGHYALMVYGKKVGAYLNIGGGDGNRIEAWSSGDVLQLNKWQHVAFTYDASFLRAFYDGREVAQSRKRLAQAARPGTTPLVIGGRQDGYDKSYFHGKIDDVRIYNRALLGDEIKAHWMAPDTVEKGDHAPVFRKRFEP